MSDLFDHPLSEIFPLMTDEELTALTADIKEHGQQEMIVTYEGKILDGRNRYRACRELGLEPKCIEWSGVGSAQAFVVSHNLHRRHLNASQRGIIGARLAAGPLGGDRHSEIFKTGFPVLKIEEAAALLNINKESISDARKVLAEASQEEIAAVEDGKASVSAIAKQLRQQVPIAERRAKAAKPHKDRAETIRANGRLWGLFRDALENISNLPRPADVARVVRFQDRSKITDTKLLPAIQWLTEFSDAWTDPDAQASTGRKDHAARKAKETASSQGAEGGAGEDRGALREAGRGTAERGNGRRREGHADA